MAIFLPCVEMGINLKVDGGTSGLEAPVSIEIFGNGTGAGVKVEAVEVKSKSENCVVKSQWIDFGRFPGLFWRCRSC
jgi:hypothetical protein